MKRCACDLVITNARIYNVFTGETEEGDIAVAEGRIVGIGKGYAALRSYDAAGKIALPAFIDAHIHIESSMLSPEEFAALAVPHGTTAVIADPHEIVNVCGVQGAEYIKEAVSRLRVEDVEPLQVFLELPSCVPATPFETSGATLSGKETEKEIARDVFFGLGEMMNFPAVLGADADVLRKIEGALAAGKTVDGHAPALSGDALNAYRAAGILTDHENVSAEDCREKLARGLYVQIRCGSSANNLSDAAAAVNDCNFRRFLLCSDDKNARDLTAGHLDDALRRLVAAGYPAKYAVAAATLNIAECYRLADMGAVAPRYFADIALVDDLSSFRVRAVFRRGVLVAEEGTPRFERPRYLPDAVRGTVKTADITPDSFTVRGHGGKFRAMRVTPYGLTTEEKLHPAPQGEIGRDYLHREDLDLIAVIERHGKNGNIGLGLVEGYGLRGGAIGISVAHDSHNLVVLGDDRKAMARVAVLLKEAGGGMACVGDGEDVFPLDIAGLMSSAPAEEVVRRTREIALRARAMGVREGYEPFMTLAFLSLAVIPKLKLLDRGLFDLEKYSFVPLETV